MSAVDLMMSSLTATALILISVVADRGSKVNECWPTLTIPGETIPGVVSHVRCPSEAIVQRCEALEFGDQDHSRDQQAMT